MDICMVVNDIGGKWPVDKQERKTISGDPASTSIHQFSQVHNKNVYCVWMDDHHKVSNWNIYFSEGIYNSNVDDWNWSNPIRVSSSANSQYYPSITMDDEGNPHVFFSNKKNPVWHARRAGNNWIAPKIISTGTAELSLFSFSRFKQGLLHTVVRQHSGSDEGVFYVRGLPDGTFAEPVKVADANFPEYPGLDIDNAGNVHIVWSDGSRGHPRNIFYTKVELPGTPPVAKINISETAGLIPFTVNFDASESYDEDGNIIDYRWSFGDGANAKGKNVSHTYTQKGTFTVVLSVIDSDMRVGTDQVEIVASTGEPFALFEPSATMGMAPFTVELDASNSKDADGEIVSYSWDFGDGVAGDGVVVTHTYATGGTFAVKLTVTDNDGKTGTSTRTITVYQKPTACFTATPDFGKPPLAVSFDASCSSDVDGTIQSYKWDFGDGLSGSAMKITHTYSTPGNLMAVLTVEDNDGYTGTTTLEIKVLDKPLAPLNVRRNTVSNKSLFFNEYINEITWEENPGNSGLFTVINYRIYRRTLAEDDAQFTLVGEAGAGELIYRDRNFSNAQEADNYVYAVTAVDDESNESDYSDYTK
jgi:PKD repeat protein